MTAEQVLGELAQLGSARMKKLYMGNGAKEPLFGVATGAMKPLYKANQNHQALAMDLYDTGNYDAMYLAGMIADVKAMTEQDFEKWMDGAYFPMAANYIVAVTLAESDLAQPLAIKWIHSGEDLRMSAGWSCFEWLLGWKKDDAFQQEQMEALLKELVEGYRQAPPNTQKAMAGCLTAMGISYFPLHEKALEAAKALGEAKVEGAIQKGKLGFKRKAVRC